MWTCPKCATEVEDGFEVCWKCGTAADGTEDPTFDPEQDGIIGREDFEADRAERVRGNLVTVGTFGNGAEAHLFRARLEAAGIPAVVLDEFGATLYAGLLGMSSGIKVMVHEKDLDRALAQARQLLEEEPVAPKNTADPDKDAHAIRRPPESIQEDGLGLPERP
jgi:hypothetical protein